MMKLQMASIPFFPRTFKNNWPIGRAKWVPRMSEIDVVANDAAMSINQPRNIDSQVRRHTMEEY